VVARYTDLWDDVATAAPRVLARVPVTTPVGYDLATMSGDTLNRYQYFEPRRRFVLFDASRGEPPPAGLVVAGARWAGAERYRAQPVVKEPRADQVLWWLAGPPPGVPAPPSLAQLGVN
jgi:hypothetical protein